MLELANFNKTSPVKPNKFARERTNVDKKYFFTYYF